MSWEDEDWESPSAPEPMPSYGGGAGGGDTQGLGDWDDEDASEEEEVVLKKPSAPMKASKARKLALQKKEEEEMRLQTEKLLARERRMNEMSALERKMEQQRIVEEADMDNARDLFMDGVGGQVDTGAPVTLENFKVETPADYKKFAEMIGNRCADLNTNPKKTLKYVGFVKDVMKIMVRDLNVDDVKDLSSYMGLLSNEKREQFKKAKGIKKKSNNKKVHVRVDRADDMREDPFDDFADDFM